MFVQVTAKNVGGVFRDTVYFPVHYAGVTNQCDFRFDLFFSFSFPVILLVLVLFQKTC